MVDAKVWYKSKTMWVAILTIIAGVIDAILNDISSGVTITALGVISVLLRVSTSTIITATPTQATAINTTGIKIKK